MKKTIFLVFALLIAFLVGYSQLDLKQATKNYLETSYEFIDFVTPRLMEAHQQNTISDVNHEIIVFVCDFKLPGNKIQYTYTNLSAWQQKESLNNLYSDEYDLNYKPFFTSNYYHNFYTGISSLSRFMFKGRSTYW